MTVALIGFIGALIIAVLAHYFSSGRDERARRAAACVAFRAAVLTELGSIYPSPASWPGDIDGFLRARFGALQTAVVGFRPFVPWWDRWRFDRSWFRYRCATGRKVDVQCYLHYMGFDDNPNYKDIFHGNVSRLLSFANET